MPKLSLNLNGTDALELFGQWHRVRLAATELCKALEAASPHGRDYQTYTAPVTAFNEDRTAWMAMLREAQGIGQQALDFVEEIERQARERRR
jgi:hypothetical protein